MESPLSSSCFICGEIIISGTWPPRRNQFESLKDVISCLCNLLGVKISEISSVDWECITDIQQSICCEKCFDVLKSVERMHEIVVNAQRQLQLYLDQVESLIAKSESPSLQCTLWSPTCFELRKGVLSKKAKDLSLNTSNDDDNISFSEVIVKEEMETEEHDDLTTAQILEDNFHGETDWNDIQLDYQEESELMALSNDPLTNEELLLTETINHKKRRGRPPKLKSSSITKSVSLVKRRKIKIIVEEDLEESEEESKHLRVRVLDEESNNLNRPTASDCQSRQAKKSAEASLKCYVPTSDDEDHISNNDDDSPDDLEQDDNFNSPLSQTEASEDEDGDDDNNYDEAGVLHTKNNVQSKKRKKRVDNGRTRKEGKRSVWSKRPFYPLVIAGDDLFLYRHDTYVRKTGTHLQCQAYQCTFQVKWDHFSHFSAFQAIKNHIELNHRTRKHFQRTLHPCLLCNTMIKNREAFVLHNRNHHKNKFGIPGARGICECCFMPVRPSFVRTHQFCHKSPEEKAAAFAANDVPVKYLRPKESEMSERKYVCKFENCKMAFKNPGNLNRHKQTHLPKELRTNLTLCPECGIQIVKEHLLTHIQRLHHPESVSRVIICKFCDKRFLPKDNSKYEAHIRRHKDEKPYLCTECGSSFVCQASLKLHGKQVHGDGTPLPCEWCDHVYTKTSSLRNHLKRRHPDKYKKKVSYKKLSKFYNDEDPEAVKGDFIGPIQKFPCSYCDIVCGYSYTLMKHMARKHNFPYKPNRRPQSQFRRGGGQNETKTGVVEDQDSLDDVETANNVQEKQESIGDSFPGSSSTNFPTATTTFHEILFGQQRL